MCSMSVEPVLLVHGGAGNVSNDRKRTALDGVKDAAKKGYQILINSGSVLDAVEQAVRLLEDNEHFNAGYGSVLTIEGEVEMDASIMEGANLRAGALGAVKDVAHPITLARLVMEKTRHVLLGAEGAQQFANEQGIEILPPGSLVTEYSKNSLEEYKKRQNKNVGGVGTVGAVAVDGRGHVAVATSTGGTVGKLAGRIGDTAVIGSGSYADDNIGAVSTTGHGDSILKVCLAHAILKRIENGETASVATNRAIEDMTKRLQNEAGAITVTNTGEVGIGFSSNRMSWAYQRKNELHYGIDHDDDSTEIVET